MLKGAFIMKKKIIALILSVLMVFTALMPVSFAADDNSASSGIDINSLVDQIKNSEFVKNLLSDEDIKQAISEIIASEDTSELIAIVLDLVGKMNKDVLEEQIKEKGIKEVTILINDFIHVVVSVVNNAKKNAGLVVPYFDFDSLKIDTSILHDFFGFNYKPYETNIPSRDADTKGRKGDANGDNRVNATDARIVLRVAARLEENTDHIKETCDIDGDGRITAKDARYILRYSAKLIPSLDKIAA